MIAFHFTGPALRDGRPIPAIGEWLVHDGPVAICNSGLHASRHPRDALEYAPGPLLHKVEYEDADAARLLIAQERDEFLAMVEEAFAEENV